MLKGALTALVTPFKDGAFDEVAFRAHIESQISGGIDGIVPCGTTGESATLTHEEHMRVVETAIEASGGRVPVVAGAGSNSTEETIKLTKHAEGAGADYALLITPYYNKPTQEGLLRHYKAVSEETSIPMILYNVPGRTGLNMLPDTTARLSELKNIVGIKEATADLEQISETISLCDEGFSVLSGDDATTLPLLSVGGMGVISVTSNIVPGDMSRLCSLYSKGDTNGARELHLKLLPLSQAMFIETNPIPVKTALAILGVVAEEFRLPLVSMNQANRKRIEDALRDYGVEF